MKSPWNYSTQLGARFRVFFYVCFASVAADNLCDLFQCCKKRFDSSNPDENDQQQQQQLQQRKIEISKEQQLKPQEEVTVMNTFGGQKAEMPAENGCVGGLHTDRVAILDAGSQYGKVKLCKFCDFCLRVLHFCR